MTKTKKIFTVLIFAMLIMSPMFASETGMTSSAINGYSMDLSWIKKVVTLIVGIFAGGYVLVKSGTDIFHAIKNSSEDPNGLKKAIGGLVLNIAVIASFFFIINYVLSEVVTGSGAGTAFGEDTAASNAFFDALSGAEVRL